jgi:hypothetical protein
VATLDLKTCGAEPQPRQGWVRGSQPTDDKAWKGSRTALGAREGRETLGPPNENGAGEGRLHSYASLIIYLAIIH